MTALSAARDTVQMGSAPIPSLLNIPLAATAKVYQGGHIALNASGYGVAASTSASLVSIGRAEETVDNTTGANGDKTVLAKVGVFKYANSAAGDAIAAADVFQPCYIVDDATVAKTDGTGTRSTAGYTMQVDSDGVWVAVGPLAGQLAKAQALAAASLPVQKRTVRIQHSDLTDADGSQTINIGAALPANARVVSREIRLATAFSGGGAGAVTVAIGGTDADGIVSATSVFTGAPAAQAGTSGINPEGKLGGEQLTATVAADVNVADLTAGDMTIDVLFVVLA